MNLEDTIKAELAREIGTQRVEIIRLRAMLDGQSAEISRLMAELSRQTQRDGGPGRQLPVSFKGGARATS